MIDFIPIKKEELKGERPDFVLVTGDAYVDHPSFGAAVIGRLLMSRKYTVGIIAQPDYNDPHAFGVFGEPRLGFLVTGGNIDSMVNHYTVAKKSRSRDLYSPGGVTGRRPNRATIVYCNKIREAYKNVPVIIGGLEASLRRLAHYDYWDNKVRRSILLDSAADLLVYGMGELQILEIAQNLREGLNISDINFVKGTVYKTNDISQLKNYKLLPDYKITSADKSAYGESFLTQYDNTDHFTAQTLVEPYGNIYVAQNPPMRPLTTSELDGVHGLSYARTYHPIYESSGGVPAIDEVRFSIISSRGCFGSCNFCALTFHQGRFVQSRSHESIVNEAKGFLWEPDFKGYIHDVGGPTANFRQPACEKQKTRGACSDRQCLFPKPCKSLTTDHSDYLGLLRKLRAIPEVKKVFIRSGVRYDYLMSDADDSFFNELCKYHVSGQLKVAPEHISPAVLHQMGKPGRDVYDAFEQKFYQINKKLGLKQFLVPYLMSSHPGSDLNAAIELAEYLRDSGHMPEQVQDFYPTPGTLSTCIYYCEFDPRTGQKVYVPKNPHEKAMQRALMQYRLPQNYMLVTEALKKAGRQDLIGFGDKCLIRPRVSRPKTEPPKSAPKPKKKKTIRNVHKKKS